MEKFKEIEKILSVLSSLVLQNDTESAEKLSAGLELLNKELKDFLKTNPNIEKNTMISLVAKVDSLHHLSKKQSAKTKSKILKLNKTMQARKGYGAK